MDGSREAKALDVTITNEDDVRLLKDSEFVGGRPSLWEVVAELRSVLLSPVVSAGLLCVTKTNNGPIRVKMVRSR